MDDIHKTKKTNKQLEKQPIQIKEQQQHQKASEQQRDKSQKKLINNCESIEESQEFMSLDHYPQRADNEMQSNKFQFSNEYWQEEGSPKKKVLTNKIKTIDSIHFEQLSLGNPVSNNDMQGEAINNSCYEDNCNVILSGSEKISQ